MKYSLEIREEAIADVKQQAANKSPLIKQQHMKLNVPIRQRLKVIGLLFLFGMSCGVLRAQNPLVKQWDKIFGGAVYDYPQLIALAPNNSYLIGGRSSSWISYEKTQDCWGGDDYWIVKANSSGMKIWDKRFGGTSTELLSSVSVAPDNTYIICGTSYSGISGDKNQVGWGGEDIWILRLDSGGNIINQKVFGTSMGVGGFLFTVSAIPTSDNGVLIASSCDAGIDGDKTVASNGGRDLWIIKTDYSFNKEWDAAFGGSDDDNAGSLVQCQDGGYLISSTTHSPVSGDITQTPRGGNDFWIVKMDSLGNKLWDKRYGGSYDELDGKMTKCADGGFILAGWTNSGISGDKTAPSKGGYDFWIIKIDSLGNILWDKTVGGTDDEGDFGDAITTTDGKYLISGTTYSNIGGDKTEANSLGIEQQWVVKMDDNGNIIWDKTILCNGHQEFNRAILDNNRNLITLGRSPGTSVGGYQTVPQHIGGDIDYWVVKFADTTTIPPSVNLMSSDTSLCSNECINFIDMTLNNPTSWEWHFPGATTASSTQKNPTNICYNNSGTFDVILISCNASGCDTLVLTNFINVYPLPLPVITVSNDTLFSSPAFTYQWWSVTNGMIAGATNNYFVSIQAGDYFVIVTDSDGCSGISDTVSMVSFIPTVNLISSDTIFCEKHCINFYDLSTNNPTSWQWFFPGSDSLTSTEQNPINICYSNYGSFDVTLIACNAAGCDTLVLPGFINEYQTLTPTITQSNDTLFSSPGVAYQWWSVDSGIITGATNFYYIPTQGGSYYVIVTDTTGCEGASNTIIITGIAHLSLGDGLGVRIVPNPNNGTFTITLPSSLTNNFSLRIIDPLGRTVYHEAKGKEQKIINIDMRAVAIGLYVVELVTDKNVYRQKFLKE